MCLAAVQTTLRRREEQRQGSVSANLVTKNKFAHQVPHLRFQARQREEEKQTNRRLFTIINLLYQEAFCGSFCSVTADTFINKRSSSQQSSLHDKSGDKASQIETVVPRWGKYINPFVLLLRPSCRPRPRGRGQGKQGRAGRSRINKQDVEESKWFNSSQQVHQQDVPQQDVSSSTKRHCGPTNSCLSAVSRPLNS